jgi:acyl carrier protein
MANADSRVLRHQLSLPRPYIAPRDQIEAALAEIWCAVLNTDCVGIEDELIDLGGDSFDAEVIMTIIEQEFGVHLSLSTLASAPTIAELAREVQRMRANLK